MNQNKMYLMCKAQNGKILLFTYTCDHLKRQSKVCVLGNLQKFTPIHGHEGRNRLGHFFSFKDYRQRENVFLNMVKVEELYQFAL